MASIHAVRCLQVCMRVTPTLCFACNNQVNNQDQDIIVDVTLNTMNVVSEGVRALGDTDGCGMVCFRNHSAVWLCSTSHRRHHRRRRRRRHE